MVRKTRKFQCKLCGWKSSEFGNPRKIDYEKLIAAQEEWQKHKEEKHPDAEPPYLEVIFDEPFRY